MEKQGLFSERSRFLKMIGYKAMSASRLKTAPKCNQRNTGLHSGKRTKNSSSGPCTNERLECVSCFEFHKNDHRYILAMECCLCLWYQRLTGTGEVRKKNLHISYCLAAFCFDLLTCQARCLKIILYQENEIVSF